MTLSDALSKLLARVVGGAGAAQGRGAAPAVGRAELHRRLLALLQPVLKANGFGRFEGNIVRRKSADWIDVIQLRIEADRETHGYALIVELGRHFLFADLAASFGMPNKRNGEVWPDVTQCHVRKGLFRRRRQAGNKVWKVWAIGPHGESLEESLSEIAQLTEDEVLPWFAWIDDLARVHDMILRRENDIEGKSRDPMLRGMLTFTNWDREVLTAFIAFRLQRWEQCIALLEPVLERGSLLGYPNRLQPAPFDAAARARMQRLLDDARAAARAVRP